jgi:hypothetical protein
MNPSLATKAKLTITRCVGEKKEPASGDSDIFTVMLNPSTISHAHAIDYSTGSSKGGQSKTPLGKLSDESKFTAYKPEKVSFELMLDGSGVVEAEDEVSTQVSNLKNIVYDYDGDEHEPCVVEIVWKDFAFKCRLDSMSIDYTLFKPDGSPIRAKVKLAFSSYMSNEEESLQAKRSSPDLTHHVVVRAGDTLPQLCHRIYKDSRYYIAVAKFNNLNTFRFLEPGTQLRFPPLRQS